MPVYCPYCGVGFDTPKHSKTSSIAVHVKSKHSQLWQGTLKATLEKYPPRPELMKCNVCATVVPENKLKIHLLEAHAVDHFIGTIDRFFLHIMLWRIIKNEKKIRLRVL